MEQGAKLGPRDKIIKRKRRLCVVRIFMETKVFMVQGQSLERGKGLRGEGSLI
jgi:hypothetical protein